MISLRPVVPEEDYQQIAPLIATADPEAFSAAQMLAELRNRPGGTLNREMAAVDAGGQIVGFSAVFRLPWWGPGRYNLWLVVDPDHRGRGIGSALHDDALRFALAEGATLLNSSVRDNDPAARRFAEQRGFAVRRHLFSSTLEVAAFDPASFAGVVEAVEATGIRFFSMADAGDTPEARSRLYGVNRACSLDIPGREPTFATEEQYMQRNCRADWYRPEAQLLAADGDRWVGLASLQPLSAPGLLFNRVTGVVSEYRGRHIALALKLLAVDYARRHGFTHIKTNNDSENAPMLAVNRKLGYEPQPGVLLLARE